MKILFFIVLARLVLLDELHHMYQHFIDILVFHVYLLE